MRECLCICGWHTQRGPQRKHQTRTSYVNQTQPICSHPKCAQPRLSDSVNLWWQPSSSSLSGFRLMRQTEKNKDFCNPPGTQAPFLPSIHLTPWKVSCKLFTEPNGHRSDASPKLNFNYLIVSRPSFPLKGRFFFHFLMYLNALGNYSLHPHLEKKKT